MSQILTVDYKSDGAAELFTKSLRDIGFVILIDHPISKRLIENVYREWQLFFDSNKKNKYLYTKVKKRKSDKRQAGYFPFRSESAKGEEIADLKEFFHIYPNGIYPEEIGSSTQELYVQLSDLAYELLEWVEEYTPGEIKSGFSEPLSQMITDSQDTLLRVLHYPHLKGDEKPGEIRAAKHEDINLITLLPVATATGLQVLDRDGIWHDVESNPNSIIINSGDMLQMCSNGHFPSTSHRVINPDGIDATKSRYSMPLFLHPRGEVQLSKTHTARKYLNERLAELGLM